MRLTEAEYMNLQARSRMDKAPMRQIPMTPAECRDNPIKKRGQKYSNVRTVDKDGNKFDSKAEFKFWGHLLIRQRAKEIFNLERQVVYVLAPAVTIAGRKRPPLRYVADMRWNEGKKSGPVVVADVKGAVTPEYRIKRHLMASVHGIEIQEIRA